MISCGSVAVRPRQKYCTKAYKSSKKEKKVSDKDIEIRGGNLSGKHLEAIMEIVGEDMAKRMGLSQHRSKARKTTPRSEFVIGARLGVTTVTSTWGNGEMGPLAICIPTGVLTQTFMRDLNLAFNAQVFIFESGTDTHFMNSDTTLTYMNSLLGPAQTVVTLQQSWFSWNIANMLKGK